MKRSIDGFRRRVSTWAEVYRVLPSFTTARNDITLTRRVQWTLASLASNKTAAIWRVSLSILTNGGNAKGKTFHTQSSCKMTFQLGYGGGCSLLLLLLLLLSILFFFGFRHIHRRFLSLENKPLRRVVGSTLECVREQKNSFQIKPKTVLEATKRRRSIERTREQSSR